MFRSSENKKSPHAGLNSYFLPPTLKVWLKRSRARWSQFGLDMFQLWKKQRTVPSLWQEETDEDKGYEEIKGVQQFLTARSSSASALRSWFCARAQRTRENNTPGSEAQKLSRHSFTTVWFCSSRVDLLLFRQKQRLFVCMRGSHEKPWNVA